MEKILETAVSQVPALAVLVVVVMVFLKRSEKSENLFKDALEQQRKDWMSALHTRDEQAANIAVDCHQCQVKCSEALKENTRMLNRLEVQLG